MQLESYSEVQRLSKVCSNTEQSCLNGSIFAVHASTGNSATMQFTGVTSSLSFPNPFCFTFNQNATYYQREPEDKLYLYFIQENLRPDQLDSKTWSRERQFLIYFNPPGEQYIQASSSSEPYTVGERHWFVMQSREL